MPVVVPTIREYQPVQADGEEDPPFGVIGGVDHSGKSLTIAEFTKALKPNGDRFVHRTLWIPCGEGEARRYGKQGDYEVIPHDGSYMDMLGAVLWATNQPDVEGIPPLIVFDGFHELTNLLNTEQALLSYERAVAKARKFRKTEPDPADTKIGFDQNHPIKERFLTIVQALRDHRGLALGTTLLEELVVTDAGGQPTKDKYLKWQSHKSLPKKVDFALELREEHADTAFLTKIRDGSKTIIPPGRRERRFTDYSLASIFVDIGMDNFRARERILGGTLNPEAYLQEVKANLGGGESDEDDYRTQRPAPAPAPYPDADRLADMIVVAMSNADPVEAEKLLQSILSNCHEGRLAATALLIGKSETNALTAIRRALQVVADGSHVRVAAAIRGEVPAETAVQRPQDAPSPAVEVDPKVAPLLAELGVHADILNVSLDDYTQALARTLGLDSIRVAKAMHYRAVGGWMVQHRDDVAAVLTANGRAELASALRGWSQDQPIDQELAQAIGGVSLVEEPAPAATPVPAQA